MSDRDEAGCVMAGLFFAGIMLGIVVEWAMAGSTAQIRLEQERAKAIEAKVGRWVIDERTGNKQFVYGVVNP